VERQPAVRDLVAKAASRAAEHRAGDLDGVDPSDRADPIQQELNPDPAAEADVRHHGALGRRQRVNGRCDGPPVAAVHHRPDQMSGKRGGVTELARQAGVHPGSDAHAASLRGIRLLPWGSVLGGTVESCPRWIR
jgi:hypothetical protein